MELRCGIAYDCRRDRLRSRKAYGGKEMTACITDIKRMAVHDGPGIRTTVFFKGCPLRCVWCHNPENIAFQPQDAFYAHKCIGCQQCKQDHFTIDRCLGQARVHYGTTVTVDELLPMLLEDKAFYDNSGGGVTLSGGECLCQADFCAELLKQLKENGIHTAVDTCGFVPRQVFEQVLPYTDLFLYDIKAIDDDVHIRCTGQSNSLILDNFRFLKEQKAAIEVRYPYVPDRNDDQADAIAAFIGETPIRVLSYHNHAGSKYAALNMENTLPTQLPTPQEIAIAEEKMSVLCR